MGYILIIIAAIIVLVLQHIDDNKNSRGLNSEIENYKHIIKEYEDYLIKDCNYEKFHNDSALAISHIEDFNSYENIVDPNNLTENITDKGSWGTGHVRIKIFNGKDRDYVMNLINQSLDYSINGSD